MVSLPKQEKWHTYPDVCSPSIALDSRFVEIMSHQRKEANPRHDKQRSNDLKTVLKNLVAHNTPCELRLLINKEGISTIKCTNLWLIYLHNFKFLALSV